MKCANPKCDKEIIFDARHPTKAFCNQRCRNQKRHAISDYATKGFDKYLRRVHNITAEQYWQTFVAQGGKYRISGLPPEPGQKLVVDHDHRTGEFRGLLRWEVNAALGVFENIPGSLQKALEYLRETCKTF